MPEGRIGGQTEMLEILNGFIQPGAEENRGSSVRRIQGDGCLQDMRMPQANKEGVVYDHLFKG